MLFRATRFGFEMDVIGDSPRAARYAGMHTRRKILPVMAISGGVAGVGGASQIGDFAHLLDAARACRSRASATRGSSSPRSPATTRSPSASSRVLLGGLQNAGLALQGVDFPSGLVGVMQGIILFCALGGELLIRYRVRFGRERRAPERRLRRRRRPP